MQPSAAYIGSMYNDICTICPLAYTDFVSVEISVEVNEIALYRFDYYTMN